MFTQKQPGLLQSCALNRRHWDRNHCLKSGQGASNRIRWVRTRSLCFVSKYWVNVPFYDRCLSNFWATLQCQDARIKAYTIARLGNIGELCRHTQGPECDEQEACWAFQIIQKVGSSKDALWKRTKVAATSGIVFVKTPVRWRGSPCKDLLASCYN